MNGWESEVFSVAHRAAGHRKTNTPSSRPLIAANRQVEGRLECSGGQAPVSWDSERNFSLLTPPLRGIPGGASKSSLPRIGPILQLRIGSGGVERIKSWRCCSASVRAA